MLADSLYAVVQPLLSEPSTFVSAELFGLCSHDDLSTEVILKAQRFVNSSVIAIRFVIMFGRCPHEVSLTTIHFTFGSLV